MNDLFAASLKLYKLAQIEKEPDTERSPQYLDEQLQAYEFMGLLNTLAHIKNQLAKVKDTYPMFDTLFGTLIKIRPGIIKNAIKGMIDTHTFDRAVYEDLRNSVMKDIENNNLTQHLEELVQMAEIELLDKDDVAKSSTGHTLNLLLSASKKAIRIISEGLHYL